MHKFFNLLALVFTRLDDAHSKVQRVYSVWNMFYDAVQALKSVRGVQAPAAAHPDAPATVPDTLPDEAYQTYQVEGGTRPFGAQPQVGPAAG